MYSLIQLAIIALPIASAAPQGIGVVICDQTAVTDWQYKNDPGFPKDVTSTYGDDGWVNFDSQICTAGAASKSVDSLENRDLMCPGCSRSEGTAVTKSLSISFKIGGDVNIQKAGKTGLDFGVQVAWSTTKSEATVEQCPAAANPNEDCACGLQYKAYQYEAAGTKTATNACGKKITAKYDIIAPEVRGDPQTPYVQWRSCRSSKSNCKELASKPLCGFGI